jgi:hypothetical protein
MNAYKHGARSAEIRNAEQKLAEWKKALRRIIEIINNRFGSYL